MEIKLNYDLMEKIYEANNGIKLHTILKVNTIGTLSSLAALMPFDIGFSCGGKLLGTCLLSSVVFTMTEIKVLNNNQNKRNMASEELELLILDLYKLDVSTSLDLLKKSFVVQNNYSIRYIDEKKNLVEQKQIHIPVSNNEFDEVVQKHIVGTRSYILTKNISSRSLKKILTDN